MKSFFIFIVVLVVLLIIFNQFVDRSINTDIVINVSKENVWKILMDHEEYPKWNPFITHISGKSEVGGELFVTLQSENNKPMEFKPFVLVNNMNQEFRWKGKLGIKGIFDGEHYFILEEISPEQTKFIQGENFTGILSGVIMLMIRNDTQVGFNAMNNALKSRVEGN